jgi:hypothetical protein
MTTAEIRAKRSDLIARARRHLDLALIPANLGRQFHCALANKYIGQARTLTHQIHPPIWPESADYRDA